MGLGTGLKLVGRLRVVRVRDCSARSSSRPVQCLSFVGNVDVDVSRLRTAGQSSAFHAAAGSRHQTRKKNFALLRLHPSIDVCSPRSLRQVTSARLRVWIPRASPLRYQFEVRFFERKRLRRLIKTEPSAHHRQRGSRALITPSTSYVRVPSLSPGDLRTGQLPQDRT